MAMEIAGKKHPEKKIVPAAMLYYRVQDPMIEMPEGEPSAEGRSMRRSCAPCGQPAL